MLAVVRLWRVEGRWGYIGLEAEGVIEPYTAKTNHSKSRMLLLLHCHSSI